MESESECENTKLRQNEISGRKISNQDFIEETEDDLTTETSCGFGPFRGPVLQKWATKNTYVLFFGILGLFNSASWAYYNGTINTMEKRFKIPSKTLGLMNVATNASQLFMSTVLGYWAGRGHRPRWVAFSQLMAILQMLLYLLPHIVYGPGEEALSLTEEFNQPTNVTLHPEKLELCRGGEGSQCKEMKGIFVQPAILFIARFVGGIGGGLFYTTGVAYLDDNVDKAESPFILSLSFFIRTLGPSVGYAVASACLKLYVAPQLTPTITTDDPRWIGAWWSGWIFFIATVAIFSVPLGMFPKMLPQTAVTRKSRKTKKDGSPHPSLKDLIVTTKRLLSNRIFLYNTIASIMYILGESPYWMFLSKYIEVQYRQSASVANFFTGTISLATSATGILLSGVIISRFQPTARMLAGWNVIVAVVAACGYVSYIYIDCGNQLSVQTAQGTQIMSDNTLECNAHCICEHTPYAPVCSGENITFISACHAGCTEEILRNGTKSYSNCSCAANGTATPGLCPSDCSRALTMFLVVLCIIELAGASGIASNFLLGMRCIDEGDKSAAMGLSLTMLGIFGFGPAPVLYGYILDMTCVVWGKTCDGTGNCWLYDSSQLAFIINVIAAAFVSIGAIFDIGVWYHAEDLNLFD